MKKDFPFGLPMDVTISDTAIDIADEEDSDEGLEWWQK